MCFLFVFYTLIRSEITSYPQLSIFFSFVYNFFVLYITIAIVVYDETII